ncbi:mannose-6-phosphate isomerase, class I [Rodentibacter caecimuris]|uniref:mannose-6-phosphate isomerase n=1 Tax=Rodentibacter caecimuris TaxID=1796644 RepID=A0ABX3KVI1_9PAST|nr:mannose-6-phosphate isomerase, class I [Rodentibacter heylii]
MIYKLTGRLQHYVWGGKNYIPTLLGFSPEKDQYYAEWWLGAHPSAPSTIKVNEQEIPLDTFLTENPNVLGTQSLAKFGNELPYLLKILDVKKPLSIQLHPTKKQAEQGFSNENKKGIALTDPKRTYKDNNHKPEMMIALSDFWLLHGFKTKEKIIETLYRHPSLQDLVQKFEQQDIKSVYSEIMQANQSQLSAWLMPIIEQHQENYKAGRLTDLHNPDYWLLYTLEAMNISLDNLDAGLVCFYLFNIVHTKIGEGIYQDAGIPHAYLRGQNIELMACSDNVIRGGLTPKYVDIPELLKVINCQEILPKIIPKAPENSQSFTYSTPAQDFALENIYYQKGNYLQGKMASAGILLVMHGEMKIRSKSTALCLMQGESAFIVADSDYQIEGIQDGYCVIAKLP